MHSIDKSVASLKDVNIPNFISISDSLSEIIDSSTSTLLLSCLHFVDVFAIAIEIAIANTKAIKYISTTTSAMDGNDKKI